MSGAAEPEIVDGDGEAIVQATQDAANGTVYSLVEFDRDRYHTIHVAEVTRAMYQSEQEMEAHFERIHSYVNLDFIETELFTEGLLPIADSVRYKTTAMDVMKFVRIYLDDECGLFLALDSDEDVERTVRAVEAALDR